MILEVKNAVKKFGGMTAVNDISFSVKQGEIFGIAGPNGSGKSTLFNLISGIPYKPTSGKIFFQGVPIDKKSASEIARMGLCRTFQKNAIFPDLTVYQTVQLAESYSSHLPEEQAQSVIEKSLSDVGLATSCWQDMSDEISVYQTKQLMIASALVMQPKIIMLDEPASGLTKPEVEDLANLLRTINKSGVTIILVEHVLKLLLSVSDTLLAINQGEVIMVGTPDDVIKDERVIEAYLGGHND